MKFPLLILVYLTCSVISETEEEGKQSRYGRIRGGHEAIPNSHPYVVSLQMNLFVTSAHFCGGSLLSETWVLTAAHCVISSWVVRVLQMDVVAGTHNAMTIDPNAQVRRVEYRIPHPDFTGDIGPYDIAMVGTEKPFTLTKTIQPINLPRNMDYSRIGEKPLKIIGWGALKSTIFIPDMPSKLQETQVTYLPFEECNSAIDELLGEEEENPLDEDAHICTGPITGGIAACPGDSGGPLIQMVPANKIVNKNYTGNVAKDKSEKVPVIIGVAVVSANPCGRTGAPTIYSNVLKYMDFIKYYLQH